MKSATTNTIVVLGKERRAGREMYVDLDAIANPGGAVEMAADGDYDPVVTVQSLAVLDEVVILQEDELQGKLITTAYASGDRAKAWIPATGDELLILVKSGENIAVADKLVVEGGGSQLFVEAVESTEDVIPLTRLKTWDAMATNLPAAAANDDMGLITGTAGTDAPTLQGVDFGGTSSDEKAGLLYVIPDDYKAGDTLTVRVHAGMLVIADDSCTLDCNAYEATEAGAVGSDLCATVAQDINSATFADVDFTITPTGLVAGDTLHIVLTLAGTDAGDAEANITAELTKISVLVDRAKPFQFKALESSGGALAANTLLWARKV